MPVRLDHISVGPMDNNVYLVSSGGASVLIDAANDADRIVRELDLSGLELIITTHRHPDHWQALAAVSAKTRVPTAAHQIDAPELPVTPDRLLSDGDTLRVGDLELEVIHLRGHTPGSIALAFVDDAGTTHLITGDSLFPGGVGKTWAPKDFDTLLGDVTSKLFDRFDDETIVHPGHGKPTTLGAERPHLDQWRERGW